VNESAATRILQQHLWMTGLEKGSMESQSLGDVVVGLELLAIVEKRKCVVHLKRKRQTETQKRLLNSLGKAMGPE